MKELVRGVRQFANASRSERRVISSALWVTPRIATSLKRRGYAGTRLWLESRGSPDFGSEVSDESLARADKAIRRLPWRMKCLERSLAIWWVAGDRAVIRLGVAPSSGDETHRFHAWVEKDGRVINDAQDVASEFLPLAGHALESTDPRLFD